MNDISCPTDEQSASSGNSTESGHCPFERRGETGSGRADFGSGLGRLHQRASAVRMDSLGDFNRRIGASAVRMDSLGDFNRRIGASAVRMEGLGDLNRRIGASALAMEGLGDLNRRIGASALAMEGLGDLNRRIGASVLAMEGLGDLNRRIGASAMRWVGRQGQRVIGWEDPLATGREKGERLMRHGWFPHHTIPGPLLDDGIDDADFNVLLLAYYRENWASVRQSIERNLLTYSVDDETKAALREALQAHEYGLYRSVCRTLMTEVEHVIRIHLYGGKVGHFSVKQQIADACDSLPVSMLPDRRMGFVGYTCLQNHLYSQIRDETDRSRFVDHRIPNRHAALHGLLTYPTVQSSLNSIFIADYVMQLVSAKSAFVRGAVKH